MNWANYDDVVGQLEAGGLMLRDGIAVNTPRPVRVRVEDGDHEKRGWFWLHDIELTDRDGQRKLYIVGAWGIYRGNDNGKTKVILKRDGPALSQAEKDAIRARHESNMKRAKAIRAGEAAKAAAQAERAWRKYVPDGDSAYLKKKGVGAHGVRFSPSGNGTLAVPMLRDGRVVGLQIVRGKDRGSKLEKQYWPAGMDKVGAFHLIGGVPRGLVLVAEGYATGATLFEATGLPVAVAFDAGSLMPVAQALAKQYRGAKILLCADDDYRTEGNPGVTAAKNAATAVGGSWISPTFAEDRPTERKGPTDFNDLHQLEGLHVVREQVEAHLRELGWQSAPARVVPPKGAGESRNEAMPSLIGVDEACERFALVYGGKGTLFDHNEHLLVPKADVMDIIPDHGWRELKLRPDRQVVRLSEVGFDPACTDQSIRCNLWGGWPTTPKEGKCDRLLELLQYLCSGEQNARELYQWALRWLAYPIQHPGAKMRTALIFHGPQGTGKNLFFEAVMSIYGEYGRIVDQAAIEDKFNDWASRKLFLIADEVVARQELYHVKNKLKSFVTGEWIRINPKNVAAHDERNHVNLVYLSNEIQPLPLEADDRRHFVIWTPAKLPPDFYQDIREELNAGGVAALHHHLLTLDLADFDEHTKPPETQAKRDLMDVGAGNVQRFIRAWLGGDIHINGAVLPVCPCGSSDLYRAYTHWCRDDGVRNPREQNQFTGELAKLPGWEKGHKDRYDNADCVGKPSRQRFMLPSATVLDQWARAGQVDTRRRDDETQTQWLTRCFFAFADVIGARP
jgi:putative DNA primase/helicase